MILHLLAQRRGALRIRLDHPRNLVERDFGDRLRRGLRPPNHKWLASPPIRAHSINIEINFAFCEILQFQAKQILPAVSCRLNE
jgi:hypothetical protein